MKVLFPDSFIVTQELIRSLDSILYWMKFIKDGGKLPKVKLTIFDDSPGIYIHDGHTRLISYYLCNGNYALLENEVEISRYKLEDYMSINLARGYVTPFNPITHVRYSDFFHVKEFILKKVKEGTLQAKDIPNLSNLYSRPRRITFLHELAEKYRPLIESVK